MRILSGLLIIAMLLMAACGGGDDATPTPASTPETTPTPAVVQEATPDTATAESTTAETGAVTETTNMTDSMGMTETTTLTGTEGMTDTASMTGTTGMTETGGMTETSGITETDTTTATSATAGDATATATLQDAAGEEVGQATFTEVDGGVLIEVTLEGLTVEAAGEHGIHLHTTGACTPDFQAAGGHFNPTNAQHGMENPNGPHAGDLPNIEIDADGNASYEATAALVTLGEGENSLLDADGSALVVHAGPDDMKTDPSGDSGDRIACGVIEQE
mgnify:CR=1 FL=1